MSMKTSIPYRMRGFSTMRESRGVFADETMNPFWFPIEPRVGNKLRLPSTLEVLDPQQRHPFPWVAILESSTAWANHGIQCIPLWNLAAKWPQDSVRSVEDNQRSVRLTILHSIDDEFLDFSYVRSVLLQSGVSTRPLRSFNYSAHRQSPSTLRWLFKVILMECCESFAVDSWHFGRMIHLFVWQEAETSD